MTDGRKKREVEQRKAGKVVSKVNDSETTTSWNTRRGEINISKPNKFHQELLFLGAILLVNKK